MHARLWLELTRAQIPLCVCVCVCVCVKYKLKNRNESFLDYFDDLQMKFKQVTPGFMKRFEGSWKVEPILLDEKLCHPFKPKTLSEYMSCTQCNGRIASKVTLQQLVEPAIVPPPPISWYLRGITSKTVEMLINDLVEEAARIKGVSASATDVITTNPNLDQVSSNEIQTLDIKERWALRRRNSRRNL
ncbi:hypothetical protein HanOQP8_Chr12g0463441 [Helianthus annuus]|nr:hypothetical protein HanOQP8_Chr12g0463441 [Helianthus annuus]